MSSKSDDAPLWDRLTSYDLKNHSRTGRTTTPSSRTPAQRRASSPGPMRSSLQDSVSAQPGSSAGHSAKTHSSPSSFSQTAFPKVPDSSPSEDLSASTEDVRKLNSRLDRQKLRIMQVETKLSEEKMEGLQHKDQIVYLEDKLKQSKKEIDSLEKEMKQTIKEREASQTAHEQENKASQQELKQAKEENKALEQNLKQSKQEAKALQQDIKRAKQKKASDKVHKQDPKVPAQNVRRLQAELAQAKQELENCKTRIFDMQPQDQISDADIVRKYETCKEYTASWVGTIDETPGCFHKTSPKTLGKADFRVVQNAFMFNDIDTAKKYPDAESAFFEMLINHYLWDNVLSSSVHFLGLDKGIESFLTHVETATKDRGNGNDSTSNAVLTPKTYKALLNDPKYNDARQQVIDSLAKRISSIFKKLLPTKQAKQIDVKGCEKLVEQAARLKNLIRSSSSAYYFTRVSMPNVHFKGPLLFHINNLVDHEAVDAETLRWVKKLDPAAADADGYVGEIVATISPGLNRAGDNEEGAVVLVKPRVLVDFFLPTRRAKKPRIR